MSRSVRARRPLRVENLEGRDVPAVTGMVFNDADHDGVRETGDTGISGVIVELYKRGVFEDRVTTGSDGTFSFDNVELETPYQLQVETPQPAIAGLTLSPTNQGGNDAVDSDATMNGANAVVGFTTVVADLGFDFGFGTMAQADTLTLGGTVFSDPDDTGAVTTDGVAGVTVELLPADSATPLETTTTDSSGDYSFDGLAAGTYRVRIAASNFTAGGPLDGFTPSTGSVADADDDVDDDSNGAVSGTLGSGGFVITDAITLTANEEPDGDTNLTVDFGMVDGTPAPAGASISGQVFLDYDNTGVFDGPDVEGPDSGLAGVTVRLSGGNLTAPVTVTTNSNGVFTFTGLQPGTYTLTEVQPTAPNNTTGQDVPGSAGGDNSVPNVISDIQILDDEEATDYFFAEIPDVSTGGTVFQDTNGNGQLDTGEPGIPNVTVTLTGTSVVTGEDITPITVTTNASGVYTFTDLDPGTYTITQTQPTGFTDGEEQNGTPEATIGDDEFADIDLTMVATSGGFNFGETTGSAGGTGAIAGFVYTDADNDGVKDTTETGVVGVTINLTGTDDQSQPVSRTTTTTADGSFSFTGLRAGLYTIVEAQPTGVTDGIETAGTAGGVTTTNDTISGIDLADGDIATGYLFGEAAGTSGGTASLAGAVFADADNDGVRDTGETGIPGVTITLTGTDDQSQPVSLTATTGTDGSYSFTGLRAGTYTIAETQPGTGFTDGTDTAGTAGGTLTAPDSITAIALDPAEAATGYLFGEVPTSTGGTGSIAGTVFSDTDNDGVRDTGENGISAVTITLTGTDDQSQPVNLTATTGTDGTFSFTGLRPGTYAIAQTQPAGFTDGIETAGTAGGTLTAPNSITAIALDPAEAATGYLFADVPQSTGGTASISGSVFADADNDGVRDTGETGIQGVTITLTGTDDQSEPVNLSATTGADGTYTFTGLRAGTYRITETQPTTGGFTDGIDTAGTAGGNAATNDQIGSILLDPAEAATGYLFAEVPASTGGTGSLAGSVFADADNDGVRDTGETGIQGVTITLTGTDDQSQPVSRTATTGADGSFSFTGLRAGTYAIAQTQPTGFTDGIETAGTAGGTLTAPNSITAIALDPAEAATGYLFADVPTSTDGNASIAGRVFQDKDNDGVKDTGEPGIGGVTITLTGTDDQGQAVSRTTTTATNGTYSFTGLRAGTYALAQTQPTGFTDGVEKVGTAGGTLTAPDSITGIVLGAREAATGYRFGEQAEAGGTDDPADLRVSVRPDDGTLQPGDTVTLTYTVRNRGDETATGVEVLARLGGLEFVSADGDYDETTRVWTVGDLDGDGEATLEITATVPAAGTFTPTARVSSTDDETITPRNGSTTVTAGTTQTIAPAGRFWFLSSGYTNRGSAPSTPTNPPPASNRSSLAGQVFADADDDGVRDTGEAGVGGVTVTLTGTDDRGQEVTRTATTTANGNYSFTGLRPGDYSLTGGTPATGFTEGTAIPGTAGGTASGADEISDITLAAGTTASNYLFAITPTTSTGTASIAGAVFADADDDGVRDTGEAGIPGVTVTLNGPVTQTATTGTDGSYSFTGLPAGTYSVVQTPPATGFTDGDETAGTAGGTTTTNDSITAITLVAGATATGYLFAEVPTTTGGTASIAGAVFADADNDGVRDTGETGIPGVTVNLTGPVTRTVTTGTDGSYSFTALPAGTYAIVETQPTTGGFTDGSETAGTSGGTTTTNDSITGITLADAATATGYLFAEVPPVAANASIAGVVFRDTDNDGVREIGETGVVGVTITLTGTDDQSQSVSRTTTTLEDGSYSFTGLRPGNYAVAETPPTTGFTDGTETAGTSGGTTTTNDSITGITLAAGATATGYLFAEVPVTTANATPTVAAAPAAVSLTGTASRTIDLAGTFDDADIVNTVVRFNTSEGAINVELFDRAAPKTVANFLNYVTDGDYANSIFHRYAELENGTPFIVQGGGFAFDADPTPAIVQVPTDPAVQNEFSVSRSPLRGTISMAKLGGQPDSATNQFFFNLQDNSSILNGQSGGFTVFGSLFGAADQAVVDALAAIPTQDLRTATALPANIRSAFGEVPLKNYTGTAFPTDTTAANYALITGVEIVSQPEALTYSIQTGPNAAVATATIVDNRLTITGVAAGTTTVTVRATDKSGAFVDTTVNVTVS